VVVDELSEHLALPRAGALGISERVIRRRGLRKSPEQRRLIPVKCRGGPSEEAAAGRLHAVEAVTEVHGDEIQVQDLGLGELAFELGGERESRAGAPRASRDV